MDVRRPTGVGHGADGGDLEAGAGIERARSLGPAATSTDDARRGSRIRDEGGRGRDAALEERCALHGAVGWSAERAAGLNPRPPGAWG